MYAVLCHSLLLVFWIFYTSYISNPLLKQAPTCRPPVNESGKVLFLTPYIASDRFVDGRNAARVPPFLPGVESYSGLLTVNETFGSNLFFWYFPSEVNPSGAPVVLWLQGGPGFSSLYGITAGNGPYKLENGSTLSRNDYYWSEELHMIYIDNPVGVGFSFTKNDTGYPKTQEDIATELYEGITQFFQLFPELLKNDFYIAGESYAGKCATSLAYIVHEKKSTSKVKLNLKGIVIGDSFVDPINMLHRSKYFYEIGLIDEKTRQTFQSIEDQIRVYAYEKQYSEAMELFKGLYISKPGRVCLFEKVTGFVNLYNSLDANYSLNSITRSINHFFGQRDVKEQLHVSGLHFCPYSDKVNQYLENDYLRSVAPWLEILLNNYRVLIYNGQLDMACPYVLTTEYLQRMKWPNADQYKTAVRKEWRISGELAGYVKSSGNLTEVMVRDAGQMVTSDKPLWALDMILRFVKNCPFDQSCSTATTSM